MSDRDREFLRYYNHYRVQDQVRYYGNRSGWHERRAHWLIAAAGAAMFGASVASLAGAQGWFGLTALWKAVSTVIPAVSGAIVAFRALYEFDRNHTRFLNTSYDLRRADVELRPGENLSGEELRAATVRYVAEIENLLSRENRQWHKLMSPADQAKQHQQG